MFIRKLNQHNKITINNLPSHKLYFVEKLVARRDETSN